MEVNQLLGAVGSNEAPPDQWRGITGPPGPTPMVGIDVVEVNPLMRAKVVVEDTSTKKLMAAMQEENRYLRGSVAMLVQERDAATRANQDLRALNSETQRHLEERRVISYEQKTQLAGREAYVLELEEEVTELRKRLWLPVEPGNHDYHGPTKPDPDTGRPVPVPDPVHERFHGAVGDVLSGRVIPEASRQMQEALKNAPKEPSRPTNLTSTDDSRRIGCEWLARLSNG